MSVLIRFAAINYEEMLKKEMRIYVVNDSSNQRLIWLFLSFILYLNIFVNFKTIHY